MDLNAEHLLSSLAKAVAACVFIFIFLPLAVVVIGAFNPNPILTFPFSGFTLEWFVAFITDTKLVTAFRNSIIVGLVAAFLSATLAVPAALAAVRSSFKGKSAFRSLMIVPIVMPAVVIGVSASSLYNLIGLPKTISWLIIGHVILVMPYIFLAAQSGILSLNPRLEESAMILGANELSTFVEVTLPLMLPAIISGMMLAFMFSLDEFVATQFWVTPYTETIPVEVYSALRNGYTPKINALGLVLILLSLIIPVLAYRLQRRYQ